MARRPRDSDDEALRSVSPDKRILDEAKERFKRAQDWEGDFRKLYTEDVKFANADGDNRWQWSDTITKDRDLANKPCLTINKTKPIVVSLSNESRQNQPSARIKPVGERVSFKAAQVWEGIIRHIEYISNAQSHYSKAKESQLEGGIGYWKIAHDYVDDESFDQELRIAPLEAPNVYLDCDIKTVDGSDAMWGFVFEEFASKEFLKQNPGVSLPPARSPGLDDKDDWIRGDSVRVAEYYRIVLKEDELLYIEDDGGETWTGLRSDMPEKWRKDIEAYRAGKIGKDFKSRTVSTRQLQWFKIGGNEIIDRRDGSDDKHEILKGKYIPIVRLPGRERRIEGKLYRAGLVRALKDAQRMYNYNTSGEVEVVALQTKSPWIVAAAAVEGNDTAWKNANTQNAAYLTFKHKDDDGTQLPEPKRLDPPQPAQGFLEGLKIAASELEMISGVHQPQEQNQTTERSPAAIYQRQRKGDVVNYDFTDSEMQAIRHTAVILIDLAPHIYDTERVVKIKADDGSISEVNISPDMDEAHQEQKPSKAGEAIKVLFNPKIGKYAVQADVGPAYATQRQEAWDAFLQIVTNSPALVAKIGDLGFLAADFPMADKIAERLRRDIENTMPWLLEDSQVGPIVKNLQSELSNSQQQVAELLEKLADARLKMKGHEERHGIEVYEAQSKRLAAEGNAVADFVKLGDVIPELKFLIRQTIADALGKTMQEVEAAVAPALEDDAGGGDGGATAQAE